MASQTTSRDVAVEYEGLVRQQATPVARNELRWRAVFLDCCTERELLGEKVVTMAVLVGNEHLAYGCYGLFGDTAPSKANFKNMRGNVRESTIQAAETWEELPGIDKVVRKAQSLKQDKPLRNLQDLFYDSQPEELPWIRTECVIDTVQAAAYLGQAVVFLYKAIDYNGL
ncbi:HERC1, partial [Symbiodinium sp. CCMP2456]